MELNFVLGTAAELIKVYPVIRRAIDQGIVVRVLSTGQSRENFLMQYRDLHLPESALDSLLKSEGDLGQATSALKWFVRAAFISKRRFQSKLSRGESRRFVIVHGDTLSTLIGAWLGWRSGVPVVHVEAGLRSPSLWNPFPEEITRRLVSRFAGFHMAPDAHAVDNLARAKVRGQVVCTEGNTLIDAVLLSAELAQAKSEGPPFAIVNIHRFENLNSHVRWSKILDTVMRAAGKHRLIFVTHPQTRHKLLQDPGALRLLTRPEIELRDRMPFSEFISLLKQSDYLISDGGSNQEECSYLGKPCMILREGSERQEGLNSCCVLTRFDQNLINGFLDNPQQYRAEPLHLQTSPSERILRVLAER